MYLNGSLEVISSFITSTDKTLWFNHGTAANVSYIGTNRVETDAHGGAFDDFRYYSTALTTTEIAAIYNEGVGTESYGTVVQEGTTVVQGTYSADVPCQVFGVQCPYRRAHA